VLNSHGFSVCSFVVAFHLECASNQSSLALSRLTALCLNVNDCSWPAAVTHNPPDPTNCASPCRVRCENCQS
jgi:hypothetical protein